MEYTRIIIREHYSYRKSVCEFMGHSLCARPSVAHTLPTIGNNTIKSGLNREFSALHQADALSMMVQ